MCTSHWISQLPSTLCATALASQHSAHSRNRYTQALGKTASPKNTSRPAVPLTLFTSLFQRGLRLFRLDGQVGAGWCVCVCSGEGEGGPCCCRLPPPGIKIAYPSFGAAPPSSLPIPINLKPMYYSYALWKKVLRDCGSRFHLMRDEVELRRREKASIVGGSDGRVSPAETSYGDANVGAKYKHSYAFTRHRFAWGQAKTSCTSTARMGSPSGSKVVGGPSAEDGEVTCTSSMIESLLQETWQCYYKLNISLIPKGEKK